MGMQLKKLALTLISRNSNVFLMEYNCIMLTSTVPVAEYALKLKGTSGLASSAE